MELMKLAVASIRISTRRQRQEFEPESITKLSESIIRNTLLHPIIVRKNNDEWYLVAGERRLRAIQNIWMMGSSLRCNGHTFFEGEVPCVNLGDLSPLQAMEAELEENIRRVDLSWQEKAAATAALADLRIAQAESKNEPLPTIADISEEVRGSRLGENQANTRREIILSRHLDDPDVAKAKDLNEAFKILKRKEGTRKHAELAQQIGRTFTSSLHSLVQGDCIKELLPSTPAERYDVILTDPPYGMGADEFGDSGGLAAGAHGYKDDYETWVGLTRPLCSELYRVAKLEAHAYLFCDIDRFHELRLEMQLAGWRVFRTPLIWHDPNKSRAPWPEHGPQRKYEIILFAVKGKKRVTRLYGDLITYTADTNLGHAAQKPVALYIDLLRRSITPGDRVLDPFCGTGTIFPAAHELKCVAEGMELDAASYGIAASRLKELK